MSEQEAQNTPLRELVRHSLTMQEQQREDSLELTKMVYSIAGDMKAYTAEHKNHAQYIIDNANAILKIQNEMKTYQSDKDMILGASKLVTWLGGIGGLCGIGAFLLHLFK